uniref:LolMLa n=1 Tax=Bichromomyia olmeca TaxID=715919 RepID=A0A1B1V3G1_9DIPT|nr:LolMLa [Bichromomyia olmeca]
MIRCIVLICLLPQVFGFWWWWNDYGTTNCVSTSAPKSISIDECSSTSVSNAIVCRTVKGNQGVMNINFEFKIDRELKSLPIYANYKVRRGYEFQTTKFSLPEDVCKNQALYKLKEPCPLKPGSYKITFPLKIPNIKLKEWVYIGLGVFDDKADTEYPFVCTYVEIFTRA